MNTEYENFMRTQQEPEDTPQQEPDREPEDTESQQEPAESEDSPNIENLFRQYCRNHAGIFQTSSQTHACRNYSGKYAYRITVPKALLNRRFEIFQNAVWADSHNQRPVVVMIGVPDDCTDTSPARIAELEAEIERLKANHGESNPP